LCVLRLSFDDFDYIGQSHTNAIRHGDHPSPSFGEDNYRDVDARHWRRSEVHLRPCAWILEGWQIDVVALLVVELELIAEEDVEPRVQIEYLDWHDIVLPFTNQSWLPLDEGLSYSVCQSQDLVYRSSIVTYGVVLSHVHRL